MKALTHCQTTKYILLTVFAFLQLSGYAQHAVIVGHSVSLKSHDGFVVLVSADTLLGMVKMNQHHHFSAGVTVETNGQKQFVDGKKINLVRLYDYDSSLVATRYTDYRRLTDKAELWRCIATGKIQVFDDLAYCDELKDHIGDNMCIVDSGKVTRITHFLSLFVTDDLLRYTNGKYHTKYRAKDFKTQKELLSYVVKKG